MPEAAVAPATLKGMAAWKLPLVVVAIALPIAVGFGLGGPGVGVAIGALVGVAIVVWAVRQSPRGEIGAAGAASPGRRLLVVVAAPLEDPRAVERVAADARPPAAGGESAEVLLLAPVRLGFLDRWAGDLEEARREAQASLVVSVASLAKAGIEAEARVGDEDVVQAVEDAVGAFDATEVILVAGPAGDDGGVDTAAEELRRRLRAEFRRIEA